MSRHASARFKQDIKNQNGFLYNIGLKSRARSRQPRPAGVLSFYKTKAKNPRAQTTPSFRPILSKSYSTRFVFYILTLLRKNIRAKNFAISRLPFLQSSLKRQLNSSYLFSSTSFKNRSLISLHPLLRLLPLLHCHFRFPHPAVLHPYI